MNRDEYEAWMQQIMSTKLSPEELADEIRQMREKLNEPHLQDIAEDVWHYCEKEFF